MSSASPALSLSSLPHHSQWFGFLPEHAIVMSRQQLPPVSSLAHWTAKGSPTAALVLIDASLPRSLAAQELLEKMIFALGQSLQDVLHYELFSPSSHAPHLDDEIRKHLESEIHSLSSSPESRVAILLGEEATQLGIAPKLFRKVISTYSPAHLLQHPEHKRATWEHLQKAAQELGWTLPQPSKKGTR